MTEGKPAAKLSNLVGFRGRLGEIDPTTFESKRPQADPYSHGYSPKKYKPELMLPHTFGPQGPGGFIESE